MILIWAIRFVFRLKQLMKMWKKRRIFCKDVHHVWPILCSTFAISTAVHNNPNSWKWWKWKKVIKVSAVFCSIVNFVFFFAPHNNLDSYNLSIYAWTFSYWIIQLIQKQLIKSMRRVVCTYLLLNCIHESQFHDSMISWNSIYCFAMTLCESLFGKFSITLN